MDRAEKLLKIAVIARPNDPHIIDSYGWALFKLGDFKGALTFLEKANQMMPDDATTNDHLGDVFWKTGRYREAYYQWQRALEFNPDPEDAVKIRAKIDDGLTIGSSIKLSTPSTALPSDVN